MDLFPNELMMLAGVLNKGDMQNVWSRGPQDWSWEPLLENKIRIKV